MQINISVNAATWLRTGERGLSSEYIFERLTGFPLLDGWHCDRKPHPLDPDDFKRCELLLRAVPEFRSRLDEMKSAGKIWGRLVNNWQQIVDLLDSEIPGWANDAIGLAPKTYKFMKSLGC
jgi:hypothetical protein